MVWVRAYMASVMVSEAGPPAAPLNLMPKSSSGPPGLWLAERMMPPWALYLRMMQEAAGVERMPPRPTRALATPLAAAMRRMSWMASRL